MKKRVLIFSTAYLPLLGGAEIAVKEITDRLSDYEFILIAAKIKKDLPDVEKIGRVEVHRLGKGNYFDKLRLIFQGAKKAESLGRFDVLWLIMAASFAGWPALNYKKKHNEVPFVLTLQEGDSRFRIYSRVFWWWPWFKQIFKKADKIQAISNYLAEWAKSLGAKGEVKVIPNGVDIAKFQPVNVDVEFHKEDLKKKMNLSSDTKIIVTASRLVPKNNIPNLIEAMRSLPKNYQLFVVGDGILKEEIMKQIVLSNLRGRVRLFGEVDHGMLPVVLWTSDVFCRPSWSEGLGNAFLEAMAAGLPVVGTKVGGIPDFLKDGETGLFCRPDDPKDIAEKIKRLVEDRELRDKIKENGQRLVAQNYSWDLVAEKMKVLF